MSLVGLQKAYDSVDRELLWKVLAQAGIPAEIIVVIRQFHDGMDAGSGAMCMDDGEMSDWFAVTQGLHQGQTMCPPLVNVFFAAPVDFVVP